MYFYVPFVFDSYYGRFSIGLANSMLLKSIATAVSKLLWLSSALRSYAGSAYFSLLKVFS